MPSHVSWFQNSPNIILVVSESNLSKEEVLRQFDQILPMLDTVRHPVFICHDLTQAEQREQIKIGELTAVARHPVVTHPNRAFSYFIAPSRRAEIIIDIAAKIFPNTIQRFKLVRTLDEALQDIHQKIKQEGAHKDMTP
jgi:hypothetical protein